MLSSAVVAKVDDAEPKEERPTSQSKPVPLAKDDEVQKRVFHLVNLNLSNFPLLKFMRASLRLYFYLFISYNIYFISIVINKLYFIYKLSFFFFC